MISEVAESFKIYYTYIFNSSLEIFFVHTIPGPRADSLHNVNTYVL